MEGSAPGSPKTKNIPDLSEKIARLERYEQWGAVSPLSFSGLVGEMDWETHWQNLRGIEQQMKDAQKHAARLRVAIESTLSRQSAG